MFDNELALMCGVEELPCPQLQVTFHQPTIKEIALIGEPNFFTGVQCLLINKNIITLQANLSLDDLDNFHIFMMVMQEKTEKEKKEAVIQVLSLILPNFSYLFTPRSLIIKKDEFTLLIDENNFSLFQDFIRSFLSPSFKEGTDGMGTFNPKGKKAEEIAKKLMRGRERVAAQRAAEGGGGSVLGQYLSVLSIGLGVTEKDLSNLSLYQFFDTLERYMLYVNWDNDIRSRMAGAKNEKPIDNWMKKLR